MKLLSKKPEKKTEQEKVEARREEVLAKGRKLKYPLQWTRHRIVVSTILIAFVVLALVTVSGYLALYRFNMTGELLYRVTRILPVSVAVVDNAGARFSDYLMLYRSSIISIERQSGNQFDKESAESLYNEYKRIALTEAEEYTYALQF